MLFFPPAESGRIVTLPTLVAQISTVEKPLAVDKELANEAIYLRGITVDTSLLPKLARICAAEWVKSGSTAVLSRPGSLKARLAREQAERFGPLMARTFAEKPKPFDGAGMAKALAAFREDLAKAKTRPGYGPEAFLQLAQASLAKSNGAFEQPSPAARSLNGFIATFDLGRCVEIGQGRTLTFTNLGGRLTQPLPNATAVLHDFREIWGVWNGITLTVEGILKEEFKDTDPLLGGNWTQLAKDPTGAAFSIYRNLLDSYEFEIRFFDKDGLAADQETTRRELPTPEDGGFPNAEAWAKEPIPGDEATRRSVGLLQGMYGDLWPEEPRWSKEFLKDGEGTLDPLSVFATPFLDAMAERSSLPVLIDLPDGAAAHMDGESLGDIEKALRSYVMIEATDSLLLGAPRYPVQTTADRFPRRALPELTWMISLPLATLEDGVRYVRNMGSATVLEGILYEACDHATLATEDVRGRIFTFDASRSWIAALGELGPVQRDALLSGDSISFSTLPIGARRALSDAFYAHEATLKDGKQPAILYYPNGLPEEAVLRASAGARIPTLAMAGVEEGALPATQWGDALWSFEQMKKEGIAGNAVDPRKAEFVPFFQTNAALAVVVDGRTLAGPNIPFPIAAAKGPVSWSQIPEPFMAEIRRGYEAAKASGKSE